MNIRISIPKKEHDQLQREARMLGRIALEVARYAHTPDTTTYECVVAMKERLRQLNKKVRLHKNAGGKFLK